VKASQLLFKRGWGTAELRDEFEKENVKWFPCEGPSAFILQGVCCKYVG
jgi:hypothetical protein